MKERIKEIAVGLWALAALFGVLHTVGVVLCGMLWAHSPVQHSMNGPHFVVALMALGIGVAVGASIAGIVAVAGIIGSDVLAASHTTGGDE